MTYFAKVFAVTTLVLAAHCVVASADTFTLQNDNGGDGFVTPVPGGFDLFGSDNGSIDNLIPNKAIYSATALSNQTLVVNWLYHTDDTGVPGLALPPFFDRAGYILNGVFTQLTDDLGASDQGGVFIVSVVVGEVYGIYIDSIDSCCGRANILVTASETPLPAALPLFASGGALLGFLGWRRKRKAIATA